MQRTITLMVVLVNLAIGAVNLFLPVPAITGGQGNEMKSSIDIGNIVNFKEPGTKLSGASPPDGTIVSTGGNPSIVIISRSQAPSDDWERYRMESSPPGRKGGILAGGMMAAFRIQF
ncbi:MAG: hypothetical protein ACLPN1_00915 [Dissulfurispiraceae bacterium]